MALDPPYVAHNEFPPYSPPFPVEPDTQLVSIFFMRDSLKLWLVWRLDGDFGIRELTRHEGETLADLNREAIRHVFGLTRR